MAVNLGGAAGLNPEVLGIQAPTDHRLNFIQCLGESVGNDHFNDPVLAGMIDLGLTTVDALTDEETMKIVAQVSQEGVVAKVGNTKVLMLPRYLTMAIARFKLTLPVGVPVPRVGQVLVDQELGSSSSSAGAGSASAGKGDKPKGEVRNTMRSMFDKDGVIFYTDCGEKVADFITKWQHLRRIWPKQRQMDLLGPDTTMGYDKFWDKLRYLAKQSKDLIKLHEDWATVEMLKYVETMPVFKDRSKFEVFLGFTIDSDKPYRLSIADFLLDGHTLDMSGTGKTPSGKAALVVALGQLATALSIVFGGEIKAYRDVFEPLSNLIGSMNLEYLPDSWICHRIHMWLETVMRSTRVDVPTTTEEGLIDKKFTQPGYFLRALGEGITHLISKLPIRDQYAPYVTEYMDRDRLKIEWNAPKAGGRPDVSSPTPEGPNALKNRNRKERRMRAAGAGAGGSSMEGGSTTGTPARDAKKLKSVGSITRDGGMDVEKQEEGGPPHVCNIHLCHLLRVAQVVGGSQWCQCPSHGEPWCKAGRHPKSLRLIKAEDAKKALNTLAGESLKNRALKAHEEAFKKHLYM